MFLLQILNKKKLINNNNLLQILRFKNYIKNFKKKIFFLKKLKDQKTSKQWNFFLSKNNKFSILQQDLVMYIINVTLTNKNTIIYVTDIKGNLKLFKSTSFLNLIGKQKITQPTALLKVLKEFLANVNFLKNKPVVLHCHNVNKRYVAFLLKILENILFIKSIRIYNFLIPHNGCRPKKLKRKKRRKLKFK